MPSQWFCKVMGQELGPLTAQQLVAMVRKGELSRDDLVRKERDGEWVRAENVKGLFDVPMPPLASPIEAKLGFPAAQNTERTSAERTAAQNADDDLQRWLADNPIAAPSDRLRRTPKVGMRRLVITAALGVVVCLIAALAFVGPWRPVAQDDAVQADNLDNRQEQSSVTLQLPSDFAFIKFTTVRDKTPIGKLIDDCQAILFGSPLQMTLVSARDKITGLYGKGLQAPNEFTWGRGITSLFFVPEPFACYRDDKLLGIWDPQKNEMRTAAPAEAEPILKTSEDRPPSEPSGKSVAASLQDDVEVVEWYTADQLNSTATDVLTMQPVAISPGANHTFLVIVLRLSAIALDIQQLAGGVKTYTVDKSHFHLKDRRGSIIIASGAQPELPADVFGRGFAGGWTTTIRPQQPTTNTQLETPVNIEVAFEVGREDISKRWVEFEYKNYPPIELTASNRRTKSE